MFKHARGSSMRNMVFVWKLPADAKQRSMSSSLQNIKMIEQSIPENHNCRMRHEFRKRYIHIAKITPYVLDDIYQFLSGDTSSLPNEQI